MVSMVPASPAARNLIHLLVTMPFCLRCMQVLHELHPVCKGNGNQDVLLLHIWLMDIVGRNAVKMPHSVGSGVGNEKLLVLPVMCL